MFNLLSLFSCNGNSIRLGEQSFNDLDACAKMMNGNTFNFFLQCRVLSYGPFDTLNTKVLEKIIIGGLFMTPP